MRRSPRLIAIVASALLAVACSSSTTAHASQSTSRAASAPTPSALRTSATSAPAAPRPRFAHVVVVVLENHANAQIVGNRQAPYLNTLISHGLDLTNASGVAHPSEPNYLAMFAGSTFGVSSDNCPLHFAGANLASELTNAHLSFGGYSEGLPRTGYTGCSAGDGYARKHNPWVDFAALPPSINRPFSSFPTSFSRLPTVSFVVPNLDDDMHDGTIAESDAWLSRPLSRYAKWAVANRSLLLITWDEAYDSTNHIPLIAYGAGVAHAKSTQAVNHYSLLRTIEDMYRLPRLRNAAKVAPIRALAG